MARAGSQETQKTLFIEPEQEKLSSIDHLSKNKRVPREKPLPRAVSFYRKLGQSTDDCFRRSRDSLGLVLSNLLPKQNTVYEERQSSVMTTDCLLDQTDKKAKKDSRRAMELFASLYFQTQPKGWWKRSIPLNQWMEWTKESIRQPLLNNHQSSEACKSFKLLQVLMGDRWRPRGHDPLNSMHIVLSLGLSKVVMRDEIYVQLFKQLNKNPSAESIEKGWIIVLMVTMTFPPSKRLAPHFCDFVTQENHKLSKTILIRLEQILFKGARGKVPSMAEIKRTLETPYQPSVFGESIETVMGLEQDMNTGMPRVMVFLTEAILYLDGKQTEGIFRIPGDADVITDLRIRIDNGEYDLEGVQDPNVPASLLKCWLRDLSEPLIPSRLYQQCIQSASEGDQVLRLLQLLPDANRRILIYMTRFLQQFLDPHVVQNTLMTAHNLALVFAPNYFKCPLTHLPTLFENSKHEQTFVITLMSVL